MNDQELTVSTIEALADEVDEGWDDIPQKVRAKLYADIYERLEKIRKFTRGE